MLRRVLLALVLTMLGPVAAHAARLALVIGNDSYQAVPALHKARADASGYAGLLASRGFNVFQHADVGGRRMLELLADFYDRIRPGDTVVFVFAGHGWSDGRQNYLLPTDIRSQGSETLLAKESFALRNGVNGILDEISARGPALTVAIVDACRNNPFQAPSGTRTIGLARGLVTVAAPVGTFVAFSAGEGQTALDRLSDADPDPYSVFTRHFLQELARPQDLQSAFKATQLAVNRAALSVGHPQRPAYYDEVVGAACLTGDCAEVLSPAAVAPAPAPAPVPTETAGPEREWRDLADSRDAEAIRAFAMRHVGTPWFLRAMERLAVLAPAAPVLPGVAAPAPAPKAPAPPRVTTPERAPAQPAARPAPPLPAPLVPPQDRAAIIRATQVELRRIGCMPGDPDGVANPRTAQALRLYAMLRGTRHVAANLGSAVLLEQLRAEPERVCATAWVATRAPMALSGEWIYSMWCKTLNPNEFLGVDGTALLVVDEAGRVRGQVVHGQSGASRLLSGSVRGTRFAGSIAGPRPTSEALAFDLPASNVEFVFEGTDALGCQQRFSR